jgi:hypothetical protein
MQAKRVEPIVEALEQLRPDIRGIIENIIRCLSTKDRIQLKLNALALSEFLKNVQF